MKKIGLSVCYDTKNFGSQLQVLATIKKIEELGYETEIIRYKKKLSFTFFKQTLPRFFNPYFIKSKMKGIKKKKAFKEHQDIYENIKIRNKRFQEFARANFTKLSKEYMGWDGLKKEASVAYDAFLCGSDQLWLPSNLGSHFYTLEFAPKNKQKISYATSFGVGQIPWYQKNGTKKYLNRLDSISTREIKGAEIIKGLTNRDAKVVCDPTLLFNCEEWKNIIADFNVINKKYLFCYFLGSNEEHRKIVNEFAKRKNLKIVTIPFLDNYVEIDNEFGDIKLYDVDTNDFVNLIRNAEYVITDSFHGTVFSIINHKKFMIFNRFASTSKDSRNSRIESLCNMLEIEDRRYNDDINKIEQDINYESVEKLLNNFRTESIKYLEESLKKVD